MVGNTTLTSGRTFERIAFNDKHPTVDPVTGADHRADPIPFDHARLQWPAARRTAAALAEPQPRLHHHRPGHLLGERIGDQRAARRGRGGVSSSGPPPAASRMGSTRPTTAGLPTSASSSAARTPPVSATTPTDSRPTTPCRTRARGCPAARWPTISRTSSGIRPKAASPRRCPSAPATTRPVPPPRASPIHALSKASFQNSHDRQLVGLETRGAHESHPAKTLKNPRRVTQRARTVPGKRRFGAFFFFP